MRNTAKFLLLGVFAVLASTWTPTWISVAHAQAPAPAASQAPQQPTFRVSIDLVTTDVIVRGRNLMRKALERGIASGEFRAMDVGSAIDVIFAPLLMLSLTAQPRPCRIREDPVDSCTYGRTDSPQ